MSSAANDLGAFVSHDEVTESTDGPLKNITFCVKDNFDVSTHGRTFRMVH